MRTKEVNGHTISDEVPKDGDNVLACFEHDVPFVMRDIKLVESDGKLYAVSESERVRAYHYFDATWGIFKITTQDEAVRRTERDIC